MIDLQESPWEQYDAYLFDIDGTVLNCAGAAHYFAFCNALQSLSGRPLTLQGVTAHGNTDIGILRDALTLAQVPEESWRARMTETTSAMGRYVNERKAELQAVALPGVRNLLQRLRRRGARLGIATGNLEAIGRLKLECAGLLSFFDFGAYSDAYEFRCDVVGDGIRRARLIAGLEARLCAVGDTPADILAARTHKIPVVAVATGIYSMEDLVKEHPDWCFPSLEA